MNQTTVANQKSKKFVTLIELSSQYKLDPVRARTRLRRAHVSKPGGGAWVWPADSAELGRVRDVLKKRPATDAA